MVAVIKNIRMFVVFETKNTTNIEIESIFYAFLTAIICKDIRLFKFRRGFLFYIGGVLGRTKRKANSLFYIIQISSRMTKNNEICSRVNYSTPSATADARQASESTLNKLASVESCIIDLVRMKSVMYNHDLINPFPERYPEAFDPFELLDDLRRLMDDFSNLHIELEKEVAYV
ncbi:MAG: hypothetical protein RR397_10955 [Odoribacter sp.]